MKPFLRFYTLIILSGLFASQESLPLHAADDDKGSIKIISPKDGEVLSSKEDIIIRYEMTPGPKGDHLHFYLNNGNAGLSRDKKGWFNMTKIRPGKHILTVRLVNKIHVPIGVEESVSVTVK